MRKTQNRTTRKKPRARVVALYEEVERIRLRAERIARETGPPLPGEDKNTADG